MENKSSVNERPFLLQPSSYQVWVQAIVRSFYQAGHGSIHFFMPLIFVNQYGFSATAVGIGMGSGSLAGVLGHFLGGYLADSPTYGRKLTLLFSAGLSILAAVILALTQTLPMLILVNLIMGLSGGCYWTAADAAVIDVTPSEHRQKAFAVLVLADSLGSGLGIWGGGKILSLSDRSQILFLLAGLLLLMFLILIQVAIAETSQNDSQESDILQGFAIALQDRSLRLFVLVNVLFTTFVALVSRTLPLYFTSLVATPIEATTEASSSLVNVANLFTWCYIGFGAVLQLPLVQVLRSWLSVPVLMMSMLLWGIGFLLVWATGIASSARILWMMAALSVFSVASAIYKPFAPAIIAELAPNSLRGVYLAISYQCWSIGYFIGPILGGWAIDQPRATRHHSWLVAVIGTVCGLVILQFLGRSQVTNRPGVATKNSALVSRA